jgi:molybdopterin-guanine dinucleotide biosynthesis protein A
MLEQINHNDACVPIWNNNYVEPLFAIYKIIPFLKRAKEKISNRSFKLSELLDPVKMKIKYVSIENEIKLIDNKLESFINLNLPEDISKLGLLKKKEVK